MNLFIPPEFLKHAYFPINWMAVIKDNISVAADRPDNRETNGQKPTLVEGEDYYMENGLFVFTARFLLRRGFCCDNGCRHCPYPKESNL